ncbi:MAG: helix-turn-helix transcriptional regulator [Acetobacteraceae bacterium]|nr:helix-turn-helix transcriptional regulator [Acetobacteraceae bacterium]
MHIKPLAMTAETVTLSRDDFDALVAAAEDAEDRAALRAHDTDVAARGAEAVREDCLPMDQAMRILAGESPVRVWRERRGITQSALAETAGVGVSYLSEIESGRKPGSVAALRKLAGALRLALDDLVPGGKIHA